MTKYLSVNQSGHSIRCKLYCNDARSINEVVLFCHGFGGHKDNRAAQRMAETLLSKKKHAALFVFDLPCHGDDVKKKMRLADCDEYITLVIDFIKKQYSPDKLYVCATSFGGYLTLKYISEHGDVFDKTALRCPAVKMYEVMSSTIISRKDIDKLSKGGEIQAGFDRKINIDNEFLESLKENDITKREFFDFADKMLIIHGTKDEVVPYDGVRSFAESNVIEFFTVENADHRFQDTALMGAAIKRILKFYDE